MESGAAEINRAEYIDSIEAKLSSDLPEKQIGDLLALNVIERQGFWIVEEGYVRDSKRHVPYLIHTHQPNRHEPMMMKKTAISLMRQRARIIEKEEKLSEHVLLFVQGKRHYIL